MVVWDREYYLAEGYKQFSDEYIYVDVYYSNDKTLPDLIEKSNNFFKRLNKKNLISEKELKYFSYSFKNTSCLRKMYHLPKIHKPLYNVPGRPLILSCGTPTEKVSEIFGSSFPTGYEIREIVCEGHWRFLRKN